MTYLSILFDPTTVALPPWATTDEAKTWVLGFVFGALVRITRSSLLWFRRAGQESYGE